MTQRQQKRKLGRGLDSLLSSSSTESMASLMGAAKGTDGDSELKRLPVDLIRRGKYQPRTSMEQGALQELADSIKTQGVMQPIVVRPVAAGRYEIIAGERRWRATQLAGQDSIPCIIRKVDDEAVVAMSLIENIQREDLNPIEEATALKRLQDEFELTQQQVADAVGKSRTTVTNILRLMGLRPDVRKMLEQGRLEAGHAKALLALSGPDQSQAARQVVQRALPVRHTEAFVRKLLAEKTGSGKGKGGHKSKSPRTPDIKRLEDRISGKLGAKVVIQHTAKGRGKLVIGYNTPDELDGILAHIK